MSGRFTIRQLIKGDWPVLGRRYHVGITSVLRRCRIDTSAGLTGRTVGVARAAPGRPVGEALPPQTPLKYFQLEEV